MHNQRHSRCHFMAAGASLGAWAYLPPGVALARSQKRYPDKFHFHGQELMQRCMAHRTLLDAGIHGAAGSDFHPGPFAPLMGMQAMVTRTGWNGEVWGGNQRITVDEALRVYTINGAYATREDNLKGSLSLGKLADFVVLADDPHAVDPGKFKDVEVVRTIVGGRTVHSV